MVEFAAEAGLPKSPLVVGVKLELPKSPVVVTAGLVPLPSLMLPV